MHLELTDEQSTWLGSVLEGINSERMIVSTIEDMEQAEDILHALRAYQSTAFKWGISPYNAEMIKMLIIKNEVFRAVVHLRKHTSDPLSTTKAEQIISKFVAINRYTRKKEKTNLKKAADAFIKAYRDTTGR